MNQIEPLLQQLKQDINDKVQYFKDCYDFKKNNDADLTGVKLQLEFCISEEFIDKEDSRLRKGLLNYVEQQPDLFWDSNDKSTGLIAQAKDHLSKHLQDCINSIQIPK